MFCCIVTEIIEFSWQIDETVGLNHVSIWGSKHALKSFNRQLSSRWISWTVSKSSWDTGPLPGERWRCSPAVSPATFDRWLHPSGLRFPPGPATFPWTVHRLHGLHGPLKMTETVWKTSKCWNDHENSWNVFLNDCKWRVQNASKV